MCIHVLPSPSLLEIPTRSSRDMASAAQPSAAQCSVAQCSPMQSSALRDVEGWLAGWLWG